MLLGVAGIDRENVGAERAAQRREPAAEREGCHEEEAGIDADRLRHAAVVDGGADARAEAGALEPEPKQRHDDGAGRDEKAAIGGEGIESQIDLAAQIAGRRHRLRQGPVQILRRGDRNEDEPDRHQHLVAARRRHRAGDRAPPRARCCRARRRQRRRRRRAGRARHSRSSAASSHSRPPRRRRHAPD